MISNLDQSVTSKYGEEFDRIFNECDNCKPRVGGIIMSDDLIHCSECGRKLISEKVYGNTMKWSGVGFIDRNILKDKPEDYKQDIKFRRFEKIKSWRRPRKSGENSLYRFIKRRESGLPEDLLKK